MLQGRYQVGDRKILFKEGEPATKMFMIKGGEVLCIKQSKDRLVPIFTAKTDDIIGENAMTVNGVYAYSAVTTSISEVIEIPATHFKNIFKEAPEWLVELTNTMIARFQNTANLIAENRIIHPSLIKEGEFADRVEIDYKKLLS